MAATAQAKRHAAQVARILGRTYPNATTALDYRTPLQLLVATILSAQCTDRRVNLVTPALFAKYRTAQDYADAPADELERMIQSTGFFRNKAKAIKGAAKILVERFGGQVPRNVEDLVELPGIGRKTANVVLGTAYGVATGVVVDTHVARVSRRLGLSAHKDPAKIERDLMELIPPKQRIDFSHQVIEHGRKICIARTPKCSVCPLGEICPRVGVERSQ